METRRRPVGSRHHRIGAALVAILLALPVALVALPAPAHAAQNGLWSVLPTSTSGARPRSHFLIGAAPGQTIRDSVTVSNLTKDPITFRIYAADAFNAQQGGTFVLKDPDQTMDGVGSWIELATDHITIDGGKAAEIPFLVHVPDSAEPGDHAGGVAAMNTAVQQAQGGGNVNFDVERIVGARVYVRVNGPLTPGVDVTRISMAKHQPLIPYLTGRGSGSVTYVVTNTGNIRITPKAAVTIKGLFGRTVEEFPAEELPELLPGSSVSVTQSWKGLPPIDKLSAKVSITAGMFRTERSKAFWVFPWFVVLLLIVIVVALLVFRRWRRRRRQPGPIEGGPEPGSRPRELIRA